MPGHLCHRTRDYLNDYPRALYAALQRFCDAITPIETYISFAPAERRNPQTTKIISDYAERGRCDARYAQGTGRAPLVADGRVYRVAVSVNGALGNFILDTGASYVAVTRKFPDRARIDLDAATQTVMKTVSGMVQADLGYASRLAVGQAEAQGVVVAVVPGDDAFGSHVANCSARASLPAFPWVCPRLV